MRNIGWFYILLLFTCYQAYSQELPKHTKKVYVASDGKIYFNKSLPVYFFISTSPNPTDTLHLLKSETTPKYANPMYFDTEGVNTLRSPSAVDTATKQLILPEMDIQYQVYADSRPPKTEIDFNRKKEKITNEIHYISDSVGISLTAKDEMSGIAQIFVSINNAPYITYTNNLVFTDEKAYSIKYLSLDNTGNLEKMNEIMFHVDKTPPESKMVITGENYNNILSGNVQISIESEDKISGVKHIFVSIDDSIFHPYIGKINTAILSQGDHKLFYYASDELNNKEKVNIYPFYIDNTPPQVIEEVQGKTFNANGKEFSAGTSKLKITSFDNKSGVKEIYYSINNAPFLKYEKPIILAGFKGNLFLKSYAVDNVGNQSRSDASNSHKNSIPYIDLSAPWVGHSFKGPYFFDRDTIFISQQTKILLEAKDSESGIHKIEYQVDSSDLANYTTPITITNEGFHHISVYGYDNTDNLTRQDFEFIIDTVGPEIYERFSASIIGTTEIDGKKLNQYPGHTVIFLSATDNKSGYENMYYELNKNPIQLYTRNIKGFLTDKKNFLKITAIDKLGNKSERIIEFIIK